MLNLTRYQSTSENMDAIWRFLAGAPTRSAPPRVQSDDVYPVHMLDDTTTLRGIVMAWTMRVDDVLDPEKLHGALVRLLEIGDWKKLGGRLRAKVAKFTFQALVLSPLTLRY